MCHFEDKASSDQMWDGPSYYDDGHMTREGGHMTSHMTEDDGHMISDGGHVTRDEMFHTAMGYGLITPGPEAQDRSLAATSQAVDISVRCHSNLSLHQ